MLQSKERKGKERPALLGHWTHLSAAQKGNLETNTFQQALEAAINLTALLKLQELSAASFTKSRLRLHTQQPFRHTHATNMPKRRCKAWQGCISDELHIPGTRDGSYCLYDGQDIRCWTNGILWSQRDLSGMQTSRVERAHPKGLSQAFFPPPLEHKPRQENGQPEL